MNDLSEFCGHHCGTDERGTRHCRCCHEWHLTEADGCSMGFEKDGSEYFDVSETHEPGSHVLADLADAERDRVAGLVFGS